MSDEFSRSEKRILQRHGIKIDSAKVKVNQVSKRYSISLSEAKQLVLKEILNCRKVSLGWLPSEALIKSLIEEGYLPNTVRYLASSTANEIKLRNKLVIDLEAYIRAVVRKGAVNSLGVVPIEHWIKSRPLYKPCAVINEIYSVTGINHLSGYSADKKERILKLYVNKIENGEVSAVSHHDANVTDLIISLIKNQIRI